MGFFDRFRRKGRPRKEPKRETLAFPRGLGSGRRLGNRKGYTAPKLTPANLRYFSHTPFARRAINAIKDPVSMLDWEVVPVPDAKGGRHLDQKIQVLTDCLERPNNDDSFRTLMEQAVEDFLVVSAGAIEQQIGGDAVRPLWMWPVDGQSIKLFAGWAGGRDEARYLQTVGNTHLSVEEGRPLRNDELIYIRPNPTTASPYGYGPLEVAFRTISRQLGAAEYAGNVASNAVPPHLLWLEGLDDNTLRAFREYWRDEIEGQGQTPIVGGEKEPKAVALHGGDDSALYLKWQEFLIRTIAASFNISPQNLGLESDVNRNTSETAEDRDWAQAIVPTARLFESHLTRETIQGRMGEPLLRFRFTGLQRKDEKAEAERFSLYYKNNAITPNEQRARLGEPPLESQWADMTYTDTQVAVAAARGVQKLEDKQLQEDDTNV